MRNNNLRMKVVSYFVSIYLQAQVFIQATIKIRNKTLILHKNNLSEHLRHF